MNDNCDEMLKELGLSDCFLDAKEELEITPEQIFDLRMEIDRKVTNNQNMLNDGIALLALDEKFLSGEIDLEDYKLVRSELRKRY